METMKKDNFIPLIGGKDDETCYSHTAQWVRGRWQIVIACYSMQQRRKDKVIPKLVSSSYHNILDEVEHTRTIQTAIQDKDTL